MKKILLLMFFSTLLMIGCQSEQSFELDEEYYNNSNALVEINNEKLRSLEKEKGSFAVFVYLPNCATSTEFNNILMEFLEKKQMSFYKISGLDIDNTKIGETLKFYPSVVIYNQGEIFSYLRADSNEDKNYYKSSDNFEEWFTAKVFLDQTESIDNQVDNEMNNQYIINRNSDIDEIVFSKDKINIYIFWGYGCPHCEELFSFLESIHAEYEEYYNIYAFEVWRNENNGLLMDKFLEYFGDNVGPRSVPYFIIGDQIFKGYSSNMNEEIINTIISKYNSREYIDNFETLIIN